MTARAMLLSLGIVLCSSAVVSGQDAVTPTSDAQATTPGPRFLALDLFGGGVTTGDTTEPEEGEAAFHRKLEYLTDFGTQIGIPDVPLQVLSQVMLAVPLWLLYELGIILARFVGTPASRTDEAA